MLSLGLFLGWGRSLPVYVRRGVKGFIILVLTSQLAACTASLTAYPKRSPEALDSYSKIYRGYQDDIVSKYYAAPDDDAKKSYRNQIVEGRLIEIDHFFNEFEQALYQEGTALGLLADWTTLGLNTSGALVGGAFTKSVLAATSAAVVGGKAAFDKRALFDSTVPALLAKMQAQRKQTLVRILEGLGSDVNTYPLSLALQDLETYYNAGTIPGALSGVQAEASLSAKKADNEIRFKINRTKESISKPMLERLGAITAALNDENRVTNSQVLALANNPPTPTPDLLNQLNGFKEGQPSFTDADVARMALVAALHGINATPEIFSAWEEKLNLPHPQP